MYQIEYQRGSKATKSYSLKRNLIFLLFMSLMVMVLPIRGTSIESNVIPAQAASIRLNQTKKTMWVGDTLKLKLLNNKKKVKWSSSKKSVATVSAKGKVKAKKSGKTVITAKVKSKKYKCTVVVRKTTINKNAITLKVGDSKALYLKYPKKKITWSSSNSSVAYVKGKKVFGVAAGKAVITAKCAGKSYTCKVEVLSKEPTTVLNDKDTATITDKEEPITTLSADKLTMTYRTSMPLTLNNPKGTVTWTTSNGNIVHVDGGRVHSTFVGEAVITAQCNGVSYNCTVTVVSGETEQVEQGGIYTSKDKVALYIHTYQHLPRNFITKSEATALGGLLERPLLRAIHHKCIGGDRYYNYEGSLPEKENREYRECDINTLGAQSRGAERLVYSNDGLIYYTPDHYNTFELLYE